MGLSSTHQSWKKHPNSMLLNFFYISSSHQENCWYICICRISYYSHIKVILDGLVTTMIHLSPRVAILKRLRKSILFLYSNEKGLKRQDLMLFFKLIYISFLLLLFLDVFILSTNSVVDNLTHLFSNHLIVLLDKNQSSRTLGRHSLLIQILQLIKRFHVKYVER